MSSLLVLYAKCLAGTFVCFMLIFVILCMNNKYLQKIRRTYRVSPFRQTHVPDSQKRKVYPLESSDLNNVTIEMARDASSLDDSSKLCNEESDGLLSDSLLPMTSLISTTESSDQETNYFDLTCTGSGTEMCHHLGRKHRAYECLPGPFETI
uniref:Pecanex-like protein n=1 Tax=Rhabditophanes sp. KR3021 TaxID=114890 RepID=A0AC35UHW7_9BILA